MKFVPWVVSVVCLALLGWVWQDSQAKLAQKDAELVNMKQQYSELVADANVKIAAASSKAKQIAEEANNQIKQLADEANDKLQQANQREVPVSVGFRKALMSNGHVAMFTNTSAQSIAVVVEVSRASSGQTRSFDMTLDSGRKRELGEREGWAFVTGDTLTLSQPEHKSLIVKF
ncbi:MAG: hypothetical protein H6R16_427 [Proteobacteria bacterium]|nr:hypothetical protein [Pseudomonadota bacterium]